MRSIVAEMSQKHTLCINFQVRQQTNMRDTVAGYKQSESV